MPPGPGTPGERAARSSPRTPARRRTTTLAGRTTSTWRTPPRHTTRAEPRLPPGTAVASSLVGGQRNEGVGDGGSAAWLVGLAEVRDDDLLRGCDRPVLPRRVRTLRDEARRDDRRREEPRRPPRSRLHPRRLR